jgi:hypothetical protein
MHQHGQLMHAILQPIEEVLDAAIEAGELKPLAEDYSAASLLLGMLHGMSQHRRMCYQERITPEDVEVVVDVFWSGMSR